MSTNGTTIVNQTPECSCEANSKYLVARREGKVWTGFLACERCLTEEDISRVPGWKERLASGITSPKIGTEVPLEPPVMEEVIEAHA